MTEGADLQPATGEDETVMYRLDADGALRAVSRDTGDYRDELRSRRWDAAPLRNPEVEKTDPRIAVGTIVIVALITLIVLVAGYGVLGIWSLPA